MQPSHTLGPVCYTQFKHLSTASANTVKDCTILQSVVTEGSVLCVMLCCAMLCHAVLCFARLCYKPSTSSRPKFKERFTRSAPAVAQCIKLKLDSTVKHRSQGVFCAMLCCAMLCCTMLCCAMLCCSVLRYAVLRYAVLRHAAQCCAALCCYAIQCHALQCCVVLPPRSLTSSSPGSKGRFKHSGAALTQSVKAVAIAPVCSAKSFQRSKSSWRSSI